MYTIKHKYAIQDNSNHLQNFLDSDRHHLYWLLFNELSYNE